MVKILDCTVRDGGHITNWEFEDDFVWNLIDYAVQKGIEYLEIGYRNHFDNENKGRFYNCSPAFLKRFKSYKKELQIGIMTDTKRFSPEDFPGADKDYADFVRIATRPDRIEETFNAAQQLHNLGYKVFIQLMDVSNIEENGFAQLFCMQNKGILESIYFADSYGILTPDDIENYYNKLKVLGFEKISFHAHNQNGMALENTLRAIKLGAYSVDVSRNGMGRNGGNLDSDMFFAKFKL